MTGKWITWSDKPARLMVWVDGEVDIDNAGHLRDFLAGELTHDDIAEVVVDLSAVTFIDTSGLHALISTARRADLLTCEFALIIDPAGPVQRLLNLTHTADLFTLRAPKASALPAVPPSATRIPALPSQRAAEPAHSAGAGSTTLPHLRAVTPAAVAAVADLRTETPVTGG